MPAGIMIPARNMPSMMGSNGNLGGYGSSSGLSLGQVSARYVSRSILFPNIWLLCLKQVFFFLDEKLMGTFYPSFS